MGKGKGKEQALAFEGPEDGLGEWLGWVGLEDCEVKLGWVWVGGSRVDGLTGQKT
mgnify:CR=1 FL=1